MNPTAPHRSRLGGAAPTPFWLDRPDRPAPLPRLTADTRCDLAVVGGGYTGLWTALLAKRRRPGLDVLVVEQRTCGHAASGRNGGFCSPSITHGLANGAERWPDEIGDLQRLGMANFAAMERDLETYGIDCGFVRSGKVSLAATPWQERALRQGAELARRHGERAEFLEGAELRAYVDSPLWSSGLLLRDYALLDPVRLVDGLRRACLDAGVRIAENTEVTGLHAPRRGRVRLRTPYAEVAAVQVALATNVYRPLLRRLRLSWIPVYDYALVTEPLSEERLAEIGWTGDHGLSDAGNQFHYFRKTADDRILWGGYDAVYHWGGPVDEALTQRPETFDVLAAQFAEAFPSLADVAFTHAWGGIIDSTTRFAMFAGTASGGRIGYALGFTGLGVSATRFGAEAMLDLLAGRATERTRPAMIRRPPVPFPPEPVRYLGVQATRRSLDREDRTGRRDAWLRLLDRLGLGFDS
ncbi:NAD(P)/FAD-dependent oxidoreductase [Actinomadura parmotrematis]|uniref:FAD-binding oxidoreductase n=1 Tax=Actinomadura parmotrematis TaxID=2864039 RepID=A0ABS7FV37_9ACTN|nr:FAD-dependent oxidoreductase [Actinomadura parmotrematis]MBW8484281.1 FAD-binding oxidoreductase [Actinomadura parmotrematis]